MDINAYIDSGVLELYVAGALTEAENREVYDLMVQHPEILQEVLKIEAAIIKLTASTSQKSSYSLFAKIKAQLVYKLPTETSEAKTPVPPKKPYNWIIYSGWAAALIFGAALLWILNQNKTLESQVAKTQTEKSVLEAQIENSRSDLANAKNLLNIIRDKNVIAVPLEGQGEFANTYAKIYWDKQDNNIYLDAQGLPEAPRGKVYQVWSLKLNPLTPVSLGVIEDFNSDDNKIFAIANANDSEAFGISLEPEGGSETPTMEQLYTLGVVKATPAP